MSEWLIRCTDDLKSGAYYVGVDIHDGEQPVMILLKKDGDKTIVVGQGEPVNPHGDLVDRKALVNDKYATFTIEEEGLWGMYRDKGVWLSAVENAPAIIPASEEVYASGYDTAGNYHFCGTRTGEHIIKEKVESYE